MPSTVTGAALLVLAVVLVGLSLAFVAAFRRGRRGVAIPPRVLRTVTAPLDGAPHVLVDLAGTLGGAGAGASAGATADHVSAPLSGDACLVWELTLLREHEGEDGVTYEPRWSTGGGADLTVAYELRAVDRADPVPRPGTVEIRADQLRVSLLSSHPSLVFATGATRLRDADPDVLTGFDLPAELADAVRADPSLFRVTEAYLRAGDIVRLRQGPLPADGPVPDPTQPYQFDPLTQERVTATGTGCLAALLLVAAVAAALGGLALMR